MNEKNAVTKEYMKQNDRFADICNYFLFGGEPIIHPEDLQERDITELALLQGDRHLKSMEKLRDLLKNCVAKTVRGTTYLIIGIENQSEIHYAMPVKNMLYDAIKYDEQVQTLAKKNRREKRLETPAEYLSGLKKEDRLKAVVTITIYWNTGGWDGARSLHELLDVEDEEILKYVSDYQLNLVVPDEIKDFSLFQTELGKLLEFFSCADNGDALEQLMEREKDGLSMSGEAVQLINTCLNVGLELPEEKEETNMCKGIDELVARGEARGEARGKAQGEIRGIERGLAALVSSLKNFITDTEELYQTVIKNEIYKDTPKEEVLKYLN